MRIFTFLFFSCIISGSYSQNYLFKRDLSIPVQIGEKRVSNAWTGGFNTAQISKVDLNNDGVEDLVVYDKTSNKLSTYLAIDNNGAFSFQYDPKYESLFPPINSWVLAVDYDNDGKKDLFCGASGGDVRVYKNVSASGEKVQFEVAKNQVITEGFSGLLPLFISLSDIPSLSDIDSDGDIDIVMFDASGGHLVHYHKNLSIEKYGHVDSLDFKRMGNCWGNFMKSHVCEEMEFGVDCGTSGEGMRVAHTGSTILALDLDNDGDKDLITGNVECSNIIQLTNVGNASLANFASSTSNYPNNAEKPELKSFLAAFYEDVDFDGKKDLLISPNLSMNEGNLSSFDKSIWFYKNTGLTSPDFTLVSKNFLQEETIDLGEYTYPALADVDGDGDLDLLVGNRGKIHADSEFYATISLFENTGTASSPAFNLITEDYLNFSSRKYHNLKPAFVDINNDGKKDFVFTATIPPTLRASIGYILNNGATGININLNNAVDINFAFSDYDTPFLTDVDQDGTLDLLLGRSQGRLEYYNNTGSNTSPIYSLISNKVGGITNNILAKNITAVVANLNNDGSEQLILSDRNGELRIVSNWKNFINGSFEGERDFLFEEFSDTYKSAVLGRELFPALGDLNNDGLPDMILGTNSGGLVFLQNGKEVTGIEDDYLQRTFKVYPNPSHQSFFVKSPAEGTLQIYSITGQQLLAVHILEKVENEINVAFLTKGLYLLKFVGRNKEQVVKKLLLD